MEQKNSPCGIPQDKKNIKNKFKRIILVVFVFFFIFSSTLTVPKAQATYSWPDIIGFSYKEMLEELYNKVQGMILGMLKQQAIQTISSQVDSMISGSGSGSAKFITDWEKYLYKTPDNNTKLYMNDYLSKITSGKGSLSSYLTEGFSSSSSSGSSSSGSGYASQLVSMAKSNTTNKKDPSFSYEGNPSNMFSSGNFKNFNSYLSGINNPWSFDVNAQNEYAQKKEEERSLAAVKAQAYLGGIGVGEGSSGKGKITLPGSVIVQTKSNVMDLGNKVLASASHPEEVVTSLVSKILSQAMKQGMSMLQSQLSDLPFGSQISSALSGLNPSDFFESSSTLSSGSTSSSSSEEAPNEIGGMGYVQDSSSSSSSSSTSGSYGSSSRTGAGGVPPPARKF
ncbi:MAG TPA: hypothetical protein VK255_00530 [Patescibacteria group bacterium]|nr:hypothetical protein [Patescibacteria group bacterium]